MKRAIRKVIRQAVHAAFKSAIVLNSFFRRGSLDNLTTWNRKYLAKTYASLETLFKAEEEIVKELGDSLKDMRMLDIGVGGGRTTVYFKDRVKQYTAVDYSEQMVQACRERFPEISEKFFVADAANLDMFDNGAFDIVLFSFNGLDYLETPERLNALKEIHRVLIKRGKYIFSSHNLRCMIRRAEEARGEPPLLDIRKRYNDWLFLLFNPDIKGIENKEHAMINDGAHGYTLKQYYILPEAMKKQLELTGFSEILLYDIEEGKKITGKDVESCDSSYVYYLCRKNGNGPL